MSGPRLSEAWASCRRFDTEHAVGFEPIGDRFPGEDPSPEGQSPYREALSKWPDPWREEWGLRANALQDEGLHWRDAEVRAFVEVWNRRRVGPPIGRELVETLGTQ